MKNIIRGKIVKALHFFQKILLNFTYYSLIIFYYRRSKKTNWVIGVVETAGLVHCISKALNNSLSINVASNNFYNYEYDYKISKIIKNKIINYLIRIFFLPIILGYLSHKSKGFIYIGGSGYLIHEANGRSYEFSFLKSKNIKIICYFCGTEIRSIELMDELSLNMNRNVITTYLKDCVPGIDSKYKENVRLHLAKSADKFADHIFNSPVDQLSYIRRKTHPFLYFYPINKELNNSNKFKFINTIKIVHAPSSPIIKGTPLVRAAIKRLEKEGYYFQYTELINVNNTRVLHELFDAHIVLNQFYAFMPGLFGIEAMASRCAVLMSADERIETTLPKNSNDAWVVTEYWNIYDNLKYLLDNKDKIEGIANKGFDWVLNHASLESCTKKFNSYTNN